MTFTSPIFIFGLLPWFLLAVRLTENSTNAKRLLIILANTVFYLWSGAAGLLFVAAYSCLIWSFSIVLKRKKSRLLFFAVLLIALLPLLTVKYSSFVLQNLNDILHSGYRVPSVAIPVGISFFTFEAVSFLTDVYRNRINDLVPITDTYLYLTFFPSVTSGPIIRYQEFAAGLRTAIKGVDFAPATERLILGLCKKVLIADKLAPLANYYFDGIAVGSTFSATGLWIGSIAYSLQLFFDFSGYTDMAIGIARMLGFKMCENFNYPYCSSNITDFWRRWHISLGRWFRDYVYIPMGGNRCSIPRHIFNLLTVWLLTGIWHGADWSFVVWGLAYFVLLIVEKYTAVFRNIGRYWYGHVHTLFCVNLLWVLFRSENLTVAGRYLAGMFQISGGGMTEEKAVRFLPFLVFSAILCLPWKRFLSGAMEKSWIKSGRKLVIVLLGALAACAVVNASYTPYIYGNF